MDKNQNASALGHLGGVARAASLSPERRSEIARAAVETRWAESQEGLDEAVRLVSSGVLHVAPDGVVWRLKDRGKPCVPRPLNCPNGNGYLSFPVTLGAGRPKSVSVHRLVWTVLVGQLLPGLEINHKNGVKTDNRPENLELVTKAENLRHAREVLGVGPPRPTGEAHPRAKLTEANVLAMRTRYAAGGVSQRQLAKDFGVTQCAVFHVLKGNVWRGEDGRAPVENENSKHRQKLDLEKAGEIRRRFTAGERRLDLAAAFGCSRTTIEAIVAGRIWKDAVA